MEKSYDVYAASADEANEGWIWFADPELPSRTIVKVRNEENGRVVFCESRRIDDNYLTSYADRPHTVRVTDASIALFVSAWYRDGLGIVDTTFKTKRQISLNIAPMVLPGWRAVRAACHHPDIVARIGTRLGVLGAWLGLVGLAPVVLEFTDPAKCPRLVILIILAAVGAIGGCVACRGVKRPGGSPP